MTSPFSYTPRASSTSYRALASPTWSSSSSSWPSDPGPSSSPPPLSPVSYTSQPVHTTIHSPSPYFTYLNARYDRNMGRERELQRELEKERVSYSTYNYGKGKLVARDFEPRYNYTPPRQTLPSFKELFGDIRLSDLNSNRNISSSSSSSSTSSSWSSASPLAVTASHSYYPARQTQSSPIQPLTTLPEHVFYSSSEEDDTEDYFRHRTPFRYSQEPSLVEQPFSDEEEEGQRKDEINTQDTYSFSPERRRSTTFETSSERGLWTKTILSPTIQHQKRSSEPAISLPSSLPANVRDCGSLELFHSPPRHVSEPAPGWDSLHQDHSFANEKSITPSISPPMHPRELSLPPSSLPPSSPVFASSPASFGKPPNALPGHPDDIILTEPDCASITEDDRCTSLPEDVGQPTEDIVMSDIESGGGDSHELQADLLEKSTTSVSNLEQGLCSDDGSVYDKEEKVVVIGRAEEIKDSDLPAQVGGMLNDVPITTATTTTTVVEDYPPTLILPADDLSEVTLTELPHPSPLSSLTSSSRTTPSLDDLVYATETEVMEMETAAAVDPIKMPTGELFDLEDKESIVLRATTNEVLNAPPSKSGNQPSATLSKTSIPVKELHSTPLTNSKAVHTNGGQKRPSQSVGTGPPMKKLRVDPGRPHFDADFFSPSHSYRASHPQPHAHSNRPTNTSTTTNRVVVRVIKRVGVVKPDRTKSQQRPQPQAQKQLTPKAQVKETSVESVKVKTKPAQEKQSSVIDDFLVKNVAQPSNKYLRQQPEEKKVPSSQSASATQARLTKPTSSGSSSTSRSRTSRMIVESESESESDDENQVQVTEKGRLTSPLSSVSSSDAEEKASSDESSDDDDDDDDDDDESEEEEEEDEEKTVRKKTESKTLALAKSSKSISRRKPSSKLPRKPLPPLDPRDAEIIGLLIETMAQSRASSHTVSALYKSILQSRPGVLVRLAEGFQDQDEEEEVAVKSKKGERERWMHELVRVFELGMTRCGMFGRVNSSGRDSSDRSLEAHYFYVPERDEDQERATLIKSIMPRAGKRNETKKYKQYYWKPVEGKRLRWDAVDGI